MNNQHLGFDMKKYSYLSALSDELISAVNARDALTMQQKIDELEAAYKKCFGNRLDCQSILCLCENAIGCYAIFCTQQYV